jgi:hypothetical protein
MFPIHSVAQRSELLTWALLEPGQGALLGDREALRRSVEAARAGTGLETLDLAVFRVDLAASFPSYSSSSSSSSPRHPRGQIRTLLSELQQTMEALDDLCSSSSSSSSPSIQAYGFDLRFPASFRQPKAPLPSGGPSRPPPLSPEEAEEQQLLALVPRMLEDAAAEVSGNKLALLSCPVHITDRSMVWASDPDAEEGSRGSKSGSSRGPAVARMARGPLLGFSGGAAAEAAQQPHQRQQPIAFSSQLLPPSVVAALCRTLDELAPALRGSKLLEAKVLQTLLAAGPQLALLDLVRGLLLCAGAFEGSIYRSIDRIPSVITCDELNA